MKLRQDIIALFLILFAGTLRAVEPDPVGTDLNAPPVNRVVVILDASGSFKARLGTAIEEAAALLDRISQSKLHRWESGGEIILISMDAMPEVIWRGSLKELKAVEPEAWKRRFLARTDYSQCTDVEAGLKLALRVLNEGSGRVCKYLFAFSDLVHEPPLPDTMARCTERIPPSRFSADFPWEGFKDVSVSCFWIPAENKYLWAKVVREHGLESNFRFFTVSDSAAVEIAPPPQPVITISAEKQNEIRETTKSLVRKVSLGGFSFLERAVSYLLEFLGIVVVGFVLLALVGLVVRFVRGGRPAANRPPAPRQRRPQAPGSLSLPQGRGPFPRAVSRAVIPPVGSHPVSPPFQGKRGG